MRSKLKKITWFALMKLGVFLLIIALVAVGCKTKKHYQTKYGVQTNFQTQ